MIDLVWTHVNCSRKCEMVVNLVSLESTEIEIKPLKVKDEVVRHILETCSAYS